MKKLNELKTIALLVAGLLAHGAIQAEYQADPSFNKDLERLNAAVKPALNEKPGKSGSDVLSLRASLEETLAEAQEKATTNKKEAALRAEVEAKRNSVDGLKKSTDSTKALFTSALEKAKKTNESLQAAWAQIAPAPTQGTEAADMDTSGLEAACSEKVDTQQFLALSAQMKSAPFTFLREQGSKMLGEKAKELKEKSLENFQALVAKLKENNRKRDEAVAEDENKKRLQEIAALTSGGGDEERIASLEADKKKLATAEQTWTDKLLDASVGLVKDLSGLKDSQEKIQAVMGPFADNLEAFRVASLSAAKKASGQIYANCKKEALALGKDNPTAQNTSIATAYNFLVAHANGDANQFANGWLAGISQEARLMTCKKASADIENQFGAPMQARINQLRTPTTDPAVALQGALAVMNSLGTAGSEVARSFSGAKKSCNRIAKFKKQVDQYGQNVQSLIAQTASQQGGVPTARRASSPVANGANALATTNQTHLNQPVTR